MYKKLPTPNGNDSVMLAVDRRNNTVIIHADNNQGEKLIEAIDLNNFAKDKRIIPFI